MIIRRIGVLSAGKVLGALYAGLGLIIGLFFSLFALLGLAAVLGGDHDGGLAGMLFGVGAVIALPLFYGVLGFIGGVISAFLYNLVAGIVGGIEIEVQ